MGILWAGKVVEQFNVSKLLEAIAQIFRLAHDSDAQEDQYELNLMAWLEEASDEEIAEWEDNINREGFSA